MSSRQTAAETVAKSSPPPPVGGGTPWRWSQRWRHVFFAHWQMPADRLRRHVPAGLELDTFDGASWVTLVAFQLERVRLRGLPPIGLCSNFLELNLRTYVRLHGEPAIYFLSIHASSRLAVGLARRLTPLPYKFARMTYDRQGPDWRFQCHHGKGAGAPLLFRTEFRPTAGPSRCASLAEHCEPASSMQDAGDTACGFADSGKGGYECGRNSLDEWLLERYVALVEGKAGRMYRLVVQHPPWQVQEFLLRSAATSLGQPWGLSLEGKPNRWHFAEEVDALLWPFEQIPACDG